MRVLAHPLRLGPDGSLLTVEQGSDAESAQLLAALISTRQGEAPLTPALGMPDPRYDHLDPVELEVQVAAYLPQVVLGSVAATVVSETEQLVRIEWTPAEEEE